jgi:hypothetical protein
MKSMLGLSRLLEWAGEITGRLNGRAGRRWPACRAILNAEELEDRTVPTLLGQQLFPSNYPWNQNISNAPVAANSAAVIANIGGSTGIHPDWGEDSTGNGDSPLYGIPVNIVHGNTTAPVNVVIDNYPGESDIVPVPIPANAVIEGDYQNGPNPYGPGYNSDKQRGDSHLIVWDEDNNIAYELYGAARPTDPETMNGQPTNEVWHAAQETVWNMNTDEFRSLGYTSADAAGLSILAGLVRPDEGLPTDMGGQGAIDHALRFTLPGSNVNPQYIYPASHQVDESQGADNLPFGGRLRLMNTPAVDAVIAGMGPEAQIIATAMQQYGLVLADIGSPMYVTGSSATENANGQIQFTWNMNDVLGLEALTASDFQVVNLTPQVTGLSTSIGAANSTITITGQNFSGAAGHLTVFFGSTPATTVNFVSDTQLTAVVPGGSGTVNVTVQSGVNEVDNYSDNPDANVTAPIFGYGTSAISAADQFTFSLVSATQSTVSFAAHSVVAGNTDLVTIVVKDASGNAISGLISSAFSFGLSGGSGGTFGTVTATGTPGTYTAVFTGTTAGSASSLTATVDGVTLTMEPPVTVTPGPFNLSRSSVTVAPSNVLVGNTTTVTLTARDAYGNVETSGGLSVVFGLGSGNGGGTFSAVMDHNNGTYTATFTATTIGHNTISATINGQAVTASPPTVTIPGPATQLVITGPTGATIGNAVSETVTAYDAYGDVSTVYVGTVHFSSTDVNAGLPSNYTFQASDNGTHTFNVTMATAGSQSLTVTDLAHGSLTFTSLVYAAPTSPPPPTLAGVAFDLTHSYEFYYNFVVSCYQQYLGRTPSLAEANGWITDMENGLSNEAVEAGFIGSAEYIDNHGGPGAGWVTGMYQNLLGRTPAQSEVNYWVQQLNNGVSTTSVAYSFATSYERESDVVAADYQKYLGRSASLAEINGWVNDFLTGTSNETVVAGFVGSLEYWDKHGTGPSAWLDAAYRDILGRPADLAGYNTWLPVL